VIGWSGGPAGGRSSSSGGPSDTQSGTTPAVNVMINIFSDFGKNGIFL
jgi:hypothetical protein